MTYPKMNFKWILLDLFPIDRSMKMRINAWVLVALWTYHVLMLQNGLASPYS